MRTHDGLLVGNGADVMYEHPRNGIGPPENRPC